jgi:hypothetical protein
VWYGIHQSPLEGLFWQDSLNVGQMAEIVE